jgi:DNA-binding MarR family transcriptional regulator
MSQALATPVEWLAHVFALGTYGCERAPTRLTMITESTAVRTAKVVNEKEAMDDLLTADEFADRPREGSRHNAHVYGRLRRRLRALALTDDLSPSQAAVLTRLHKEGPSSTSALASAEAVSHQAIGAILAALETRGFIHRSPDPTDGRRQLISLTDAGVAQAEDTIGAREEWLARVLQDGLTEDERRAVRHAMALLDVIAEPDSAITD